ncbi:MAG: ATP phosphoribosyltransferase regulatory subunit [Thiolinea sp.]
MSSSDQYWALPDGISEALPDEAQRLEILRRQLIDLYSTWGYKLVIPPMVEYTESLSTGAGSNLDLQTFKITDLQTGRMMGIRADMTPQIARIDAHKLQTAQPNRLCYIGTVLHSRAFRQGASRSPLQVGAELFGHAGADSDFEVISLLLATLDHCKVNSLTLDIGHVGIFRELAKQAGFSKKEEAQFFSMLERKALPEIDQWLAAANLSSELREMLVELPRLHGPVDILDKAEKILLHAGSAVQAALNYLKELSARIASAYPTCQLHIDLTELSGYDYHTGIVYAVYSSDCGDEIARGGRYDGVGKLFGRERPATGFSTDLRKLSQFSDNNQEVGHNTDAIFAPCTDTEELNQLIADLRDKGHTVIRQLSGSNNIQTPRDMGCNQQIIQDHNQWIVAKV